MFCGCIMLISSHFCWYLLSAMDRSSLLSIRGTAHEQKEIKEEFLLLNEDTQRKQTNFSMF